jgi:hypothetical protein
MVTCTGMVVICNVVPSFIMAIKMETLKETDENHRAHLGREKVQYNLVWTGFLRNQSYVGSVLG